MMIAIIHLSDIHINSDQEINMQCIQKILPALREIDSFDCVWLMVTGDVASEGKPVQYKKAQKMVNTHTSHPIIRLMMRNINVS